MALATKDRFASEAVEKARRYVAEMSEPSRTRISEILESNIENYELFFGHPLTDEKDPENALLGQIPLPLEDMCGDILLTKEEISGNIEILALEVRALKESASKPLNPSFDDCTCTVAEFHRGQDDEAEARQIHDLLLSINGGNALWVIGEVLRELCEGGLFNGSGGFLGGESFEPFFAEHHLTDQAGSRLFAEMLDAIWSTVELENLLCEVGQGRKSISDLERNPRHGSLISDVRKALAKP